MAGDVRGIFSFGSMTLLVGGLALFGLLAWGWMTGQPLPLLPALLVAAVNIVGAVRLLQETKVKKAAAAESAAKKCRAK